MCSSTAPDVRHYFLCSVNVSVSLNWSSFTWLTIAITSPWRRNAVGEQNCHSRVRKRLVEEEWVASLTEDGYRWVTKRENRFSGSTWVRFREKEVRTGQDSQTKKSQSGNISPICMGKSPHCTDWNQNLHDGSSRRRNHVCKVSSWNFRGYDFTGGRISRFPIDGNGPCNSAARLRCLWSCSSTVV